MAQTLHEWRLTLLTSMGPSAHSPTAKSVLKSTGRESLWVITRSRSVTAEAWARSGSERFRMGEERFGSRQSTLLSARRSLRSMSGLGRPCSSAGLTWDGKQQQREGDRLQNVLRGSTR